MSNEFSGGAARYTNSPAVVLGATSRVLANLEGIFAVGQDSLRLLAPSRAPFVRRLMPARPATQANVPGAEAFAAAE